MNAQQILCVIPYCQKDITLTRKILAWIEKISPRLGPHCCLMAADSLVPHDVKVELGNTAKRIFYYAETAIVNTPPGATGWPKASNAMFKIVSEHVQSCFKMPFLWMEPDCTPLKPSWLDEIAVSYSRCPKRYMGALIASNQPPMPPLHLAGCAVYPPDAAKDMLPFCVGESPWDIANAAYVIPRTIATPLIHHHYGTMELPPTFKAVKAPGDPENTCTLDFIREGATLFHRCKDGTLIDVLSQANDTPKAPAAEPHIASTDDTVKRGPGRPRKELVPA